MAIRCVVDEENLRKLEWQVGATQRKQKGNWNESQDQRFTLTFTPASVWISTRTELGQTAWWSKHEDGCPGSSCCSYANAKTACALQFQPALLWSSKPGRQLRWSMLAA